MQDGASALNLEVKFRVQRLGLIVLGFSLGLIGVLNVPFPSRRGRV